MLSYNQALEKFWSGRGITDHPILAIAWIAKNEG